MYIKVENVLGEWNNSNPLIPLMVIGARQTGKTYIIDDFCKKIMNIIYILI